MGQSLRTSWVCGGGGWSLTGNAGTAPGTNFLGTTDNEALELRANGKRALRLEPTPPRLNTVSMRASGGIWLGTTSSPSITSGHFIDTSTGAYLTSTGTWTNNSDRKK